MFDFQIRGGEVLGVVTGKDDKTYIKLKCLTDVVFKREGEVAAPVQIVAYGTMNASARTLRIGDQVDIDGVGAVGSHLWEKREFGKTKEKELSNYYLYARKISVVKGK